MHPKKKLQYSLIANISLFIFQIILLAAFSNSTKYWRIGWYDDLNVISVRIDNPIKYGILLLILAFTNGISVFINEFGGPVLSFYPYNPDKKVISDFTKNELNIYTNAMFFITDMRYIFSTMILVSQIDIAIWQVVIQQIVCIFTVRILLNEKEFITDGPTHTMELDNML